MIEATGKKISPLAVPELCRDREVYIWGAQLVGRYFLQTLMNMGISPTAFIDSDVRLQGLNIKGIPILPPDGILTQGKNKRLFIFLAAYTHIPEMRARCLNFGLVEGVDFLPSRRVEKENFYTIEASDHCNLRCMACPRCNPEKPKGSPFVDMPRLVKALEKINREDPGANTVELSNWGEPLMNPQLPEIVQELNRHQLYAVLSSNLNLKIDLTPLIKTKITKMTVSVSGFGPENYERTHTGGHWENWLANVRRLAALRDEFNPELVVMVAYHLYRHNQGEEYRRMLDLCAELNLVLYPTAVQLNPLDVVADYQAGRPLPEGLRQVNEMLLLNVDDALKMCQEQKEVPCPYKHLITLGHDLSVKRCCLWYKSDLNQTAPDFLDISLEDILADRQNNPLCDKCRAGGLHQYVPIHFNQLPEMLGAQWHRAAGASS